MTLISFIEATQGLPAKNNKQNIFFNYYRYIIYNNYIKLINLRAFSENG